MEQIVYTSRASKGATSADLFNIIEVSARNNPDREVTGFLIATRSEFLQLVEGPTERLEELLSVLKRDPRHCRIQILLRDPIQERHFPAWKMQRFDTASGDPERVLSTLSEKRVSSSVLGAVQSFLLSQLKAA